MKPIRVVRKETEGLEITWQQGNGPVLLSSDTLRRACPCATCREERGEHSHAKPLGGPKRSSLAIVQHTREEQLTLREIWAVGNYALGLRWADGHDDGIYPFELLWELSLKAAPPAEA